MSAGAVQVFHVVPARRLQIDEHRRLPAHPVELREIDGDAEPAGDRGQVNDAVGRSADREQDAQRVLDGFAGEDLVGCQPQADHRDRLRAGPLRDSNAIGGHGGRGCGAGHHHAERLRNAGHRARGSHHRAGAYARNELIVDGIDFLPADFVAAESRPEAATVGARADALAAVRSGEHRTGDELDRRHVGRNRAHQLRGNRLVTAADQHHRIHRLRADHFLGVHRHEIAQVHAGRMRKALVDGNRRKVDRDATGQHDAALHRLDELRRIAMAGVVPAAGVDDPDDRTRQRVVAVPCALDECLAKEQREFAIAVAGQALLEAAFVVLARHGLSRGSKNG